MFGVNAGWNYSAKELETAIYITLFRLMITMANRKGLEAINRIVGNYLVFTLEFPSRIR